MMLIAIVLYILLPMFLVSTIVPLLSWWTPRIRVVVLTAQLIATVVASLLLPGTWLPWATTLALGAIIALARLIETIKEIRTANIERRALNNGDGS